MSSLAQKTAAALAGLSTRRLQQMAHEDDPPPKCETGYPAREFGQWLNRRFLRDGIAFNYEAERARLTHEQANKTALQNEELRNELVSASEVEAHWSDICDCMRTRLAGLPQRVGALTDPATRPKIIAAAAAVVRQALAEVERDALTPAMRDRCIRTAARCGASEAPDAS